VDHQKKKLGIEKREKNGGGSLKRASSSIHYLWCEIKLLILYLTLDDIWMHSSGLVLHIASTWVDCDTTAMNEGDVQTTCEVSMQVLYEMNEEIMTAEIGFLVC
jgi:hypothetical protein